MRVRLELRAPFSGRRNAHVFCYATGEDCTKAQYPNASPDPLPMKQVHAARHAIEAHLIRDFLLSHGIAAEVRGEFLTSGWGELPVDVCSVWVTDDAQFEAANDLLLAFLSGNFARKFSADAWRCPDCGERLEGQFTQCWSCGASRTMPHAS